MNRTPMLPDVLDGLADSSSEAGYSFQRLDRTMHRFSFAELGAEVRRVGRALLGQGLHRGDRVSLLVEDNDRFVITFLGAIRAGIVPVPIAPPWTPDGLDAERRATIASISLTAGSTALVTSETLATGVRDVVDTHSTLTRLLTVETLEDGPDSLSEASGIHPGDLAFLQFTSGSTSNPRGVRVTHGALAANARAICEFIRLGPDDRGVTWLPLFHDMGLIGFVLAPLWVRCPVHFLPTVHFVMHPRSWMRTIHELRGTVTFAPNFAFALAARVARGASSLDLSSLRVLGCGAEPIHPDTIRNFLDAHASAGLARESIVPCYGMAESTLAVTMQPLGEGLHVDRIDEAAYRERARALPGDDLSMVSCGRPATGHRVWIVDDEGHPLPQRHVGEIVTLGPSVCDGYEGDAASTSETFAPEGLRTGDLGYFADDRLYVTGRRKDLIIIHGRNYDPHDLERQVEAIAGVRSGCVVAFSVPGTTTEQLVVVAEARRNASADLEPKIKERIRVTHGLACQVALLPPRCMPKTTSGKVQRRKVRAAYLEDRLPQAEETET